MSQMMLIEPSRAASKFRKTYCLQVDDKETWMLKRREETFKIVGFTLAAAALAANAKCQLKGYSICK